MLHAYMEIFDVMEREWKNLESKPGLGVYVNDKLFIWTTSQLANGS
jgi:hypothetical protein